MVLAEDHRFSLNTMKQTNDKMQVVAEELGELLNLGKYDFTFFYRGEKVALKERLGDREIGVRPNSLIL